MLTQLPFEIVDHIIGYLDFRDVRSIARVCSVFRVPAQLRLFRTIEIIPNGPGAFPDYIESILSSPHLLQYSSRLVLNCFFSAHVPSLRSLWSHLPIMHRFVIVIRLVEADANQQYIVPVIVIRLQEYKYTYYMEIERILPRGSGR